MVPGCDHQLGNCAIRISPAGAGKPNRLHGAIAGAAQIMQEVITLLVFAPFAVIYMKQPIKLDYLWAALCLVGAVCFVFRSP